MTYTVKEISEKMGLTDHTVRFYTDKGLLPCRRDKNNRRIFDEESINWLRTIQCLRKCGISIEDIRAYSALCTEGSSTLNARYEFMKKQRTIALKRLEEAKELVRYMEHKVRHYEDILGGRTPDDTNPSAPSKP
ncbi:MAG: MerR family transcriptional regulator [Lachnospiraceae bacterium]|nr:MerR family transcriptional regulator [Lachnospiraceae bacterium]